MAINVFPSKTILHNSDGEVIGEPDKDTLQTEDRAGTPLMQKILGELRLQNEYLAEMLGDNMRS